MVHDAALTQSSRRQQAIRPSKVAHDGETEPLLRHQTSSSRDSQSPPKQLSTRHAFAVLVSIQIGSGIFASPAQVDSNVPSPGAALLVWILGGLLSWAGAASFAELGAALPLNGGMQEYLRHVYGDTMAFLMAWIYIAAVKPSSMAIQSIVIAESIGSVGSLPLKESSIKAIAFFAFIVTVLVNSVNTRITMRLSESFTVIKITTVGLIVIAGLIAVVAHFIDPQSSLSGAKDWYSKNWFHTRPSLSEGHTVDWTSISAWERYGHYCTATYAGLWAFDGWDNANIVASEIQDPGRALPKAIKLAMVVVLSSFELVNIAFYILLPWAKIGTTDAVAVAAFRSLFGRPAGILITILIALSCAGSITSNVFAVGRLTVAASQRHYLPAFLSRRGPPKLPVLRSRGSDHAYDPAVTPSQTAPDAGASGSLGAVFDAPIYANVLALILTLGYISVGSFETLLPFVGMAMWVFYVSTVLGLLILRSQEPDLSRPYRPPLVLPAIFIVVGSLVIVRTAMFAPRQSGVLAVLLVAGSLVSRLSKLRE